MSKLNDKAAEINAQVQVGTVLVGKFDIAYRVIELGDKSIYVVEVDGNGARLTLNRRSLHSYTITAN